MCTADKELQRCVPMDERRAANAEAASQNWLTSLKAADNPEPRLQEFEDAQRWPEWELRPMR